MRKTKGVSLNIIIIAALGLLVLVVLAIIFSNKYVTTELSKTNDTQKTFFCNTADGTPCTNYTEPSDPYKEYREACENRTGYQWYRNYCVQKEDICSNELYENLPPLEEGKSVSMDFHGVTCTIQRISVCSCVIRYDIIQQSGRLRIIEETKNKTIKFESLEEIQ